MEHKKLKKNHFHQYRESMNQAEKILYLFGGVYEFCKALKEVGRHRDPANVYRWTYPRSRKGNGGFVPTHAWQDVLLAARKRHITIPVEIFIPVLVEEETDIWS